MSEHEFLFELKPEAIPGLLAGALVALEEARSLQHMAEARIGYVEGLLRAVHAVLVPQEPSEPPSPGNGATEAYGGVMGARPGDKLNLETMGGGQ